MSVHRFTISLEDPLFEALQAEARANRRSASAQAAYCIDQCLRFSPGSAFNAQAQMEATAEGEQS
jgi:hypothetical protein